jgi:SAM-dependent methyltransferase
MLTVRYERLGLKQGDRVLDQLVSVRNTFAAMAEATPPPHGTGIPADRYVGVLRGDATCLPFADHSFDHVIVSEVLEHIQDDVTAIAEMTRLLAPGGVLAVTVPTWLPEKINWMLADEYHAPIAKGGHVRIYAATELKAKLRAAGLSVVGQHHAHALHSPYWWLKCAVGVTNDDHPLVARYRKLLEWDIVEAPRVTRFADKVLNPVLGKSLVVYARKASA